MVELVSHSQGGLISSKFENRLGHGEKTRASRERHCDALNRNGPYRLIYLNGWSIRNGTIQKCVTVEVGFKVSDAQVTPGMEHSLHLQIKM